MLAGNIGNYALSLAAAVAFLQWLLPLFAVHNRRVQQFTIQAAKVFFYLITLSIICLAIAFYYHDFSLLYVAENSNSRLPWYYRLSAVWGGHEGSLLLWIWILSVWIFVFTLRSKALPSDFRTRVLAVLGWISFGFCLFIIFTSSPFVRLGFAPFDGQDLNPLLQDPGMIFHPPMLYTGYVGFAIAFAFVCAGLWQGQLDSLWLRRVRPWTISAWLFLTIGICLGSYWAYYELGWGGWWFWDPVENASLMPWLVGTALMHSLAVAEKRGIFRTWTAMLGILTFTMSIVGTFLVRSGVLTSVHAFASDPTRGLFILGLLGAISLPAFILLIIRSDVISSSGKYQFFSRETALLLNNWLLIGAWLIVFIGTIYPLIANVLHLGKISVGPPYFNTLIVPLAIIMLIALGIGPLLRWRRDNLSRLVPYLIFSVIFAGIFCFLLCQYVLPTWKIRAAIATFCVGFALAGVLCDYYERVRHQGWHGFKNRGSESGMIVAHLGLMVSILGITATSLYGESRDLTFQQGKEVAMGGYHITLQGLQKNHGSNWQATVGRFIITKPNDPTPIALLTPEKRYYDSSTMPMTESSRLVTPQHDLYLAMGEEINPQTWAVRVQFKPYVMWIWIGALIMALGGIIAASDRAYRKLRRQHA